MSRWAATVRFGERIHFVQPHVCLLGRLCEMASEPDEQLHSSLTVFPLHFQDFVPIGTFEEKLKA